MTEAERVYSLMLEFIDEIEDLRHINRYNVGTILNARYYLTKSMDEIEKLVVRDDSRIYHD